MGQHGFDYFPTANLTRYDAFSCRLGGGNAPTLRSRRETSQKATPQDGDAETRRPAKGAPFHFPSPPHREPGCAAYTRIEGITCSGECNFRSAAGHQLVA